LVFYEHSKKAESQKEEEEEEEEEAESILKEAVACLIIC